MMVDNRNLSVQNKWIEPDCEGSPAKGIMSGAAIMTPIYVIVVSLLLWIFTRSKDRSY